MRSCLHFLFTILYATGVLCFFAFDLNVKRFFWMIKNVPLLSGCGIWEFLSACVM